MSFSQHNLKVTTKTWVKDSHGLYDYDTSDFNSQTFEVPHSFNLYRVGSKLKYGLLTGGTSNNQTNTSFMTSEIIARVSESQDGICILPNDGESSQFWQLINNDFSKGHLLKVEDVIKIGRTIIKVRHIKVKDDQNSLVIYKNSIFNSFAQYNAERMRNSLHFKAENSTKVDKICKICLGDKLEEDNPLISPCNCSGSVKYVHLKCLQSWMLNKFNISTNINIININWQGLNCELCKQTLPLIIKHEGKELMLIPYDEKAMDSYALLEFFSKDNVSTGVFLVSLSSNEAYRIGRGQGCEFQIKDISVSRVHATLTASDGKLYIKDNSSRFGTLVLIKEPIILNPTNLSSPWIQCGRTCFKFSLNAPWISFIPCFSSCKLFLYCMIIFQVFEPNLKPNKGSSAKRTKKEETLSSEDIDSSKVYCQKEKESI